MTISSKGNMMEGDTNHGLLGLLYLPRSFYSNTFEFLIKCRSESDFLYRKLTALKKLSLKNQNTKIVLFKNERINMLMSSTNQVKLSKEKFAGMRFISPIELQKQIVSFIRQNDKAKYSGYSVVTDLNGCIMNERNIR